MHGNLFGFYRADGAFVSAAELRLCGAENNSVSALFRYADSVYLPCNARKIADGNDFIACIVSSQVSDNGVVAVVTDYPAEAVLAVIILPEGGVIKLEFVKLGNVTLKLPVGFVFKQKPVKRLLIIPLDELTEFAAHKEKLFTGIRNHKAEE